MKKENISVPKKGKNKFPTVITILFVISLLLSIGYLAYNIGFASNQPNQLFLIINSFIMVIVIILYGMMGYATTNKLRQILAIMTSFGFIVLVGFNLLVTTNILKLPTQASVPDFSNKSINEAITWASENNIEFEQEYAYSDSYPEYQIINQNVLVGSPLKELKKIKFVVSKGPNYNEIVILPVMSGWDIDQVLEYIDSNFLNNVNIEFIINDDIERNTVINQSKNGQIRRNDFLTINFSLGSKGTLPEIKLIDLKNKSLFEATLWLKKNGINYKINYTFHNNIKRNYVISTDNQPNTMLRPFETTVNLVVSKGKEIIVPNLLSMETNEIVDWIMKNNLKIEFNDAYHETIQYGKIIRSNYKEKDIIEENTLIVITTSKGKLTLEQFNTLTDLRNWADKNDIELEEVYEFNDTIKKGNIINTYPGSGEIIKTGDKIKVTISNGKAINIPNFVGKSKDYVRSKCNEIGLSCSIINDGYNNNVAKDIVVRQSKLSGAKVIIGASLNVYISAGKAPSYSILIQENWWTSSITSSDAGINMLKAKLSSMAPGVTFNFVKKASNSLPPGYIHEDSPIKGMQTYNVNANQSYTIWISN
ncbi:MAG: PASTA domain-containing protein [Bacilli bacterium]